MAIQIEETKQRLKTFSIEDLKTLQMMTDNYQLKALIANELVERNQQTKSTNQ